MKVAGVCAISVSDLAERLTPVNLAICSGERLQVSIKGFDERIVGQSMTEDDDLSPAGACICGENYQAFRGCIDRQSAICISTLLRVPILAEMVILSKVLSVVPAIIIPGFSDTPGAAYRIVEAVGNWNLDGRGLGHLLLLR